MKPVVKKCVCGRVTNPLKTNNVTDAWIKNGVACFEFSCPQCTCKNVVKMIWDENIRIGTNRIMGTPNFKQMS